MDLHRYAALRRQWRRSPPLQQMVQAYLGIEPDEDPQAAGESPAEDEEAAIRNFMNNFAAAGGRVH
jgi:hypothetical protein